MSAPDESTRLPPPRVPTTDAIWLIVVSSLCLVMVGAVSVIAVHQPDKLEAIFMASVSFLAGMLSPSPVSR